MPRRVQNAEPRSVPLSEVPGWVLSRPAEWTATDAPPPAGWGFDAETWLRVRADVAWRAEADRWLAEHAPDVSRRELRDEWRRRAGFPPLSARGAVH